MKIRRFLAPDMRQAIRMVREQQGPDAVILSSRRVETGIEIVSAMDYDEDLVTEMVEREERGHAALPKDAIQDPAQWEPNGDDTVEEPQLGGDPASGAPARSPAPAGRQIMWSQDPTLVAMRQEIEGLRDMLQDQLGSLAWNDLRMREPGRARLICRLERLGLEAALAQEVAAVAGNPSDPDRSWREAIASLRSRISCVPVSELGSEGVVVVVGPSGVGKTTTLAKLAARHVQGHGRHSVALVTTDVYRIGAYRQLQTFGQVLGVPVYLAQTPQELGDVLRSLRDKQRVFVDTTGLSQRDLRLTEELAVLDSIPAQRTLLVVGANMQQAVLEETIRVFGAIPLAGAVLTKIDEATSLGPAVSAFCRTGLSVMYLSEGQRVPEDLHPARSERLVDRAVSLAPDPSRDEHGAAAGPTGFLQNRTQYAHVSA